MTRFNRTDSLISIIGVLRGPGGDVRVSLAIDTGASLTMLSRTALARAGYNPLLGDSRTFFNTEHSLPVTVLSVRALNALGEWINELEVVAHDLPAEAGIDGLLGLNAFRDKRLVIDFRAGQITLD